jgi:hypothetical protein
MKLAFFFLLLLGTCAFGGEPLTVVKSYEEFAAQGLKADVLYYGGKVGALRVESIDPVKKLPEWMQAFYLAKRNAETAEPEYEFDMSKPDRVSAFIGWNETKADWVLIIGPDLREFDTFKGKKYLAISVNDLIAWRGHEQGETKPSAK